MAGTGAVKTSGEQEAPRYLLEGDWGDSARPMDWDHDPRKRLWRTVFSSGARGQESTVLSHSGDRGRLPQRPGPEIGESGKVDEGRDGERLSLVEGDGWLGVGLVLLMYLAPGCCWLRASCMLISTAVRFLSGSFSHRFVLGRPQCSRSTQAFGDASDDLDVGCASLFRLAKLKVVQHWRVLSQHLELIGNNQLTSGERKEHPGREQRTAGHHFRDPSILESACRVSTRGRHPSGNHQLGIWIPVGGHPECLPNCDERL
ncbi:hypothetical protein V8F20_002304 [Naviculisporaceae sp. PSN 640]